MMTFYKTPTLLSIAILAFSLSLTTAIPTYFPITRSCGAPDPSTNLSSTHRWLRIHEPEDNDLLNATLIRSHRLNSRAPLLTVSTYFHIVSSSASSSPANPQYVTETMISEQLSYLNTHFAQFSITFNLLGTTRTTNDIWASNGNDMAMKSALRSGTYDTLNIYFQSDLQEPSFGGGGGGPETSVLLGFCTLPSARITPSTPLEEYTDDGCNILSATMPGGTYFGYNLGGTSVHEAGHFFGLLHTFHGETCAATNFGDFVADTPQQSVPTEGCPAEDLDSCPDSGVAAGWTGAEELGQEDETSPYGPQGYSGPDMKGNFMDYSSDVCYTAFTAGQAARAVNLWRLYREGR